MTTVTSLMAISLDAPAGASLALPPVAGPTWGEHNQSTDCAAVGVAGGPGTASPSHCQAARRSSGHGSAQRDPRVPGLPAGPHHPERAGLPAYGSNRRVPGPRREEVVLLAGVSVDYYTRLERGNLSGSPTASLTPWPGLCSWTRPNAPTCSTWAARAPLHRKELP